MKGRELIMNLKKAISLLTGTVMMISVLPTTAFAAKQPPEPIGAAENFFSHYLQLNFTYNDSDWLEAVDGLTVDGNSYVKADSSIIMDDDDFVSSSSSYNIEIGNQYINKDGSENKIVISADGYSDLNLSAKKENGEWTVGILSDEIAVESVDIEEDSIELKEGETKKLTLVITPEDATNKNVVWESDDSNVADVDAKGNVSAVSEGTANITVTSDDGSKTDSCTVTVTAAENKTATVTGEKIREGNLLPKYYFALMSDDQNYISGISEIYVNDKKWEKDSSDSAIYGEDYYIDLENNRVLFASEKFGSEEILKNNDIIKIINPDYEDVVLKVTIKGDDFSVSPFTEGGEVKDEYKLYVRLVGDFEAAIIGQKDYDGITSASTSVTENKNSNAEVQGVILPKGETPDEDTEWKLLKDVTDINGNPDKSYVEIDPDDSGMIGVYNTLTSAVTLCGTPEKAGTYKIKVYVTDQDGREAESNQLPFVIYTGEETLESRLKLEYCTQTEDGKYMYDMEPWKIKNFSEYTETVTVPKEIKAWYGSHTSGVYGELGKSVPFGTSAYQTLIVPEGCDLTLVNMKVLSGVKIVVKGSLTLTDTSIDGVIEVEDGGTFSMNYDKYGSKFTNGSMINGQIVMKDGSTVENAKIYSNTNYLDNDGETRKNANPVVTVSGNVTVKGNVYIAGDEAATGTAGQAGLEVKNGNINLTEGAFLAVYGGGNSPLTTDGGKGVILENGTISGKGTLVALGGSGWFGNGAYAVAGTGDISVKNVYLEGGNSIFADHGTAGGAAELEVIIDSATNSSLNDGKVIATGESTDRPTYWIPPLGEPDINDYYIPENGSRNEEIKEITLNKSKITLYEGESYELKATITPDDLEDKTILWTSDDEDVASVKDGVVKAVGKGEAVITASASNGKTAKCTVSVLKAGSSKGGSSYSLEEGRTEKNSKNDTPVIGGMDESIFDDVSTSDTRYASIKNVYEKGWMIGIEDRVFAPEGTLTRGMAAQILWNKAGNPEPSGVSPFLDVTSEAWYSKAVAWAYEQKIVSGYDNVTFGPDDYVTTEQFNIMMDIFNGKTPQAYIGGASNATRGWVAVMLSE